MASDKAVIEVRGYERKKQLAPKTWVVTTVKAHRRAAPRRRGQPARREAA